MIARLLAAIGRKIVQPDPHPQRKPAPSAVEDFISAQVEPAAPLSEHERSALALSCRVPAAYDTSDQGPRRRTLLEFAEVQQLQADAEGMEIAHHDLLLVSAKSGTPIPDVLALEATAYLTAEEQS
ncbi:hypothetical protein [Isoptericola aurantiacus]|uniref:hypothetical protein n=1 Tax=Isoptericola aurantiacus TaxID=3377839 RepID=UPI00383AAE6D